jgi:hypothetical protein
MFNIPLKTIPSQSLSVQIGTNLYDLSIRACGNGVTVMDLAINNVVTLSGQRIVPNWPIIPYRYLENGNFILQTENQEYPDYTRFGVDQYLIYASQDEIEALNG